MFRARNLFNKTAQGAKHDQEGRCSSCGGDLYTHRE